MKAYLDALQFVLDHGVEKNDRTGVGTKSVFGLRQEYDLNAGFPAVTTKKLAWRACVGELLWFIEGSRDERRLAEITHGTRDGVTTIWTPNSLSPYWRHKAEFPGDLGRIYGVQWRHWKSMQRNSSDPIRDDFGNTFSPTNSYSEVEVDQLKNLVEGLQKDPNGRRHVLTAWNPGELDDMALPPCHMFAQFYVANGRLSCQMYQRSNDLFLGSPFNIASYSLLTHMIAQVCGLGVDRFIHVTGDAHIYLNHLDQVREQLKREPMPLPRLELNPDVRDITKFTMDDIRLLDYKSHPAISAPMAV